PIFDRLVFPKSATCSCKSLRVEFLAEQRKFHRHFKSVFWNGNEELTKDPVPISDQIAGSLFPAACLPSILRSDAMPDTLVRWHRAGFRSYWPLEVETPWWSADRSG